MNTFPLIRLIAARTAQAAAILAVTASILVACAIVGPAWVLPPLTVLVFAWLFA